MGRVGPDAPHTQLLHRTEERPPGAPRPALPGGRGSSHAVRAELRQVPEPRRERDSGQRGQPGPGPDAAFPAPGTVCPRWQKQHRLSTVQHGVVRCPAEPLDVYGRNFNYSAVQKSRESRTLSAINSRNNYFYAYFDLMR